MTLETRRWLLEESCVFLSYHPHPALPVPFGSRSPIWIRKLASQAIFHLKRHLVIREPRIKYYFIASKNRKRLGIEWEEELFANLFDSLEWLHEGVPSDTVEVDGVWVGGQRSTFRILVRKSPPPLLFFTQFKFPRRVFGSPFCWAAPVTNCPTSVS